MVYKTVCLRESNAAGASLCGGPDCRGSWRAACTVASRERSTREGVIVSSRSSAITKCLHPGTAAADRSSTATVAWRPIHRAWRATPGRIQRSSLLTLFRTEIETSSSARLSVRGCPRHPWRLSTSRLRPWRPYSSSLRRRAPLGETDNWSRQETQELPPTDFARHRTVRRDCVEHGLGCVAGSTEVDATSGLLIDAR